MATDLYYRLLGIPLTEQPPNHYRLLGLPLFEANEEVIASVSAHQYNFVRVCGIAPEMTHEVQALLVEINEARNRLLNADTRREYDRRLRERMAGSSPLESGSDDGFLSGSSSISSGERSPKLIDSTGAGDEVSAPSWIVTSPPIKPATGDMVWLVGSSAECNIRVRGAWVSRKHCRVWMAASAAYVEDLGSTNGTFVNDVRIDAPVALCDDDIVSLGRKTWLPWPIPPDCPGRDITVFLIGRGEESNLRIDDRTVSKYHAQLIVEGQQYTLQDLNSTNGTRVGSLEHRVFRHSVLEHEPYFFGGARVYGGELIAMARRGL
ncbi:MAG: FHA domain-containing protein [Lacipirellulaceae bacterium]